MPTLQDVSKFAFSLTLTLTLALCGRGSGETVALNADSSGNPNAAKGREMLYGFPLTLRLNLGVTATINRSTGRFSAVSTGPVPLFANSTAVASHARFLYVSNSYIDGQPNNGSEILGYSINPSNGNLTPISGPPQFPPPISIQGLATTPDGSALYGADFSGSIYAFTVDSVTGALTSIPGSPFASGPNVQLVVDPTGKFLYASNDGSPSGILAFAIDPTGALHPIPGAPLPGSTVAPDSEPYGIVDTGSFVYVALSATNHIAAFSVDRRTGALTPVPGSPFSAGEVPIFIASVKNFLYAVNAFDGSISAYGINPHSGALTPVPGSPFGSDGGALATDAAGKYLYLGSNRGIQGYNIDSSTGALTRGSESFGEDGVLGLTIVQLSPRDAQ